MGSRMDVTWASRCSVQTTRPSAQMASFLARALGPGTITPEPPHRPDPAWPTTLTLVATGSRIVNVPTSGSPTLGEALADAAPGDRLVLASGIQHGGAGGKRLLRTSGTPSAWIAIRGADRFAPSSISREPGSSVSQRATTSGRTSS